MLGQLLETGPECRGRNIAYMVQNAFFLQDAQVFQRDRCGHRMAGIGISVIELGRTDHLCHLVTDNRPANGLISGAQTLGDCHDVRPDVHGLAAEPVPGPPKSTDHLVSNQQDFIFVTDPLDFRPVAVRRHNNAAGALHRLRDKGGYIVFAKLLNFFFEFLRPLQAERVRGHIAAFGPPVRLADMVDAGDRHAPLRMHIRHPPQAA